MDEVNLDEKDERDQNENNIPQIKIATREKGAFSCLSVVSNTHCRTQRIYRGI